MCAAEIASDRTPPRALPARGQVAGRARSTRRKHQQGIAVDKTVAVIGGSGFVGRAVIELLARENVRVAALCRDAERAKHLKTMGVVGQVVPVAGNALNDEDLERVIAQSDAVVNLVGVLAESGRQRFDALHAKLPGRIGKLAAKHGVRDVVQISAIGAVRRASSKYLKTKAAGEKALLDAFPRAVILRPSIIFGPRDKFFNRFASLAMISPVLPLPGLGSIRMQPVYVGDVAEAVRVALGFQSGGALAKRSIRGRVFELGGPDIYKFRQIMRLTYRTIHRRRLLFPIPLALMSIGSLFTGLLPNPPLTLDQVRLLSIDNVVGSEAHSLEDLGIDATPISSVVPDYLSCYRPGGKFPLRGRV